MKVPAAQADRFARQPDPALVAVLVYGPDGGLVRERAETLIGTVVEDLGDPFRVAELGAAQLREDPARLRDEAAAMALTGGRRVVRLREAGDGMTNLLKGFLDAPGGDALVVLEAGDLPNRSSLRRLFEAAKRGAALPCYRDDERSLPAVIAETLGACGLDVSRDASAFLAANLGGDRQVTRRELEKLALYKGEGPGRVELADAIACVGDTATLTLDDLAFAVAGGDLAALERALSRSLQEGVSPVGLLRAVARHFQRLHFVAGLVAAGHPAGEAVKRLRPPVFWKQAGRFTGQAGLWTPAPLGRALGRLLEAETACKQTGNPAEVVASRVLLELAANAPRGGRTRR